MSLREQAEDAQRARAGETILPEFRKDAFHCQLCHVFAQQSWGSVGGPIYRCLCRNCSFASYWYSASASSGALMIYPKIVAAPQPHVEMPADVAADYREAGLIVTDSPRGAAALLRLAVQKLMPHLGETSANLNADIAALVQKGLDPDLQRALDSLRVVGNNAVHPGELDLRDDRETAEALFNLLNFIVEDRLARPKKLEELYNKLPEGAREAIARRDGGV
ncbi:MAG: DUF4145 domain-containing protein [Actinomycetota bacterium]|nr:DUF4145 domain-containing protein [Actinomycetota bacterium]